MRRDVLVPSLAAALLCSCLSIHAQMSPMGGRSDVQPARQQVTYVGGKVVSDDGAEIEDAEITVRCEGEPVQVTHPDADGTFHFALGGKTWGGITDTSMSNSPTMATNTGNASFACEIRVSGAGFVSQALEMQQGSSSGFTTDFGTIVLHRVDRIQQSLISAKTASAPPKARSAYVDGLKAARQGKWTKAAKEFSKATQIDGDFAAAWADLGWTQMFLGDDANAEVSWQNAIRADSKITGAYEGLSEVATRKQRWSEVIRWTEKALLLDPLHSTRMWFLRSLAQYTQKDLNGALESATRGLSSDTQHNFPRLELLDAQILLDKRDLPGALGHMQNYVQINPKASDAEFIRQKIKQIAEIAEGNATQNAQR
jgi:Tfp pilus assembly protein PilF